MKKSLFFISKHMLSLVFMGLILAAFGALFFVSKDKMDENRRMAELPTKLSFDFPKKFEAYYLDNFPRRQKLIKRYNKLRWKKLGINNYLLFGDNNWLFFNSKTKEDTDEIGDYLGTNRYSDKLLADNVEHLQKEIKSMEAFGGKVYVMIVPNKETVYPELMPDDYKGRQAQVSKADQIMAALKEHGVRVIESKDAIVAMKDKGVTYLRTDTHWNRLGAFSAYKEIEKRLIADGVRGVRPLEMVSMEPELVGCGDLQRYLAETKGCEDENRRITYNRKLDAKCENTGKGVLELNAEETRCTAMVRGGKKMMMVRDSFAEAFMPMLSTQFAESIYLWRGYVDDNLIRDTIAIERPDVIILEYLERFAGRIGDNVFE